MDLLSKLDFQLSNSIEFAICEMLFYRFTAGYFHTTIEQFILTFILSPFIIQIDIALTLCGYSSIFISLIYPFLIWIFEIVGGFTLIYYFGRNNAWEYRTDDALFCGTIRLYYYPLFVLLGLISHYKIVNKFIPLN